MYPSIWSSVNTPPSVKKALSFSKESNALSNEVATVSKSFYCSSEASYKSKSTADPGWILFLIPSIPAINIAENAK